MSRSLAGERVRAARPASEVQDRHIVCARETDATFELHIRRRALLACLLMITCDHARKLLVAICPRETTAVTTPIKRQRGSLRSLSLAASLSYLGLFVERDVGHLCGRVEQRVLRTK